MSNRLRHRIIGPLAIVWLVITAASVVMGALAWSRLSRGLEVSAETAHFGGAAGVEATRRDLKFVSWTTFLAGAFGVGTGLFALYFYRVDYRQERTRREFLEHKLQAEEALLLKSAFLANMSHEIRTPMNAILGFSELLEPEGLTPRQSQYVRAIRDSGASLLQLINDILDLSKIEAGRLELHPEPTDMRDSCEFLRTVFAEQAAKKSLQLKFELSPDLPRALLLDRVRLRQVLVNLLGNAVKFTKQGTVCLRVSWEMSKNSGKGALSIDVQDSGVGIPAERQNDLFQSFVQADSSRPAEQQGTGLGLAIVKRLTEMMNGTLTLDSIVGKGTVVHVRLPDIPVSVGLPVGDHADPAGAVNFNDFAPATFLVVDDNETNRELMAGMFGQTHHRLHFAGNGKQALESLHDLKIDVVLLDIRMPVMDGRTALAEIRKQPRLELLPVIAVTASCQAAEEPELRSKFTGYIRKPFSRQTLYQELDLLLQRVTPARADRGQTMASLAGHAAGRGPRWRQLAIDLRGLLETEWPLLRDSLAINDTRAFGHALRLLAEADNCPPLLAYAAALTTLAEGYVVRQLECHLAEFPAVVASIEGLSAESTEQIVTSM